MIAKVFTNRGLLVPRVSGSGAWLEADLAAAAKMLTSSLYDRKCDHGC